MKLSFPSIFWDARVPVGPGLDDPFSGKGAQSTSDLWNQVRMPLWIARILVPQAVPWRVLRYDGLWGLRDHPGIPTANLQLREMNDKINSIWNHIDLFVTQLFASYLPCFIFSVPLLFMGLAVLTSWFPLTVIGVVFSVPILVWTVGILLAQIKIGLLQLKIYAILVQMQEARRVWNTPRTV